jgi:hypothetical protein
LKLLLKNIAMIKINIKSFFGKLLFEYEKENNTIKETVLEALNSGADLSSANLRGANLIGANLSDANLSDADLRDADLSGANLSDANLIGADLSVANLSGANLIYANLSDADLRDANLSGANLIVFKTDLWSILLQAKKEILGLKYALINGKVDGSTYEGECACLVGTIANVAKVNYKNLIGIKTDISRPIERFFLCIKKNDTPETSQFSKLAVDWIEEFEVYLNALELLEQMLKEENEAFGEPYFITDEVKLHLDKMKDIRSVINMIKELQANAVDYAL